MGARQQPVAVPGQHQHLVGGLLRGRRAATPAELRLQCVRARPGRGDLLHLLLVKLIIGLHVPKWSKNTLNEAETTD